MIIYSRYVKEPLKDKVLRYSIHLAKISDKTEKKKKNYVCVYTAKGKIALYLYKS